MRASRALHRASSTTADDAFARRRRTIAATLAAGALGAIVLPAPAFAQPASAQAWPERPVRIIIPAAPGGSSDPLARLVAEELSRVFKQPFPVENRPGANGNIGSAMAAKSPPDGHTLLFGWAGTLVSAVTLYGAKPYHPQKDLDPIVLIGSIPNVLLVNPAVPVRTLDEFTTYLRRNPGKLNFGSTGSGSSYHLSGELHKKLTGTFMTHIPYTSPGSVFSDLLSGQIEVAYPGLTAAIPYVRDGRLRALAVMADKRSDSLPNVPTTHELGQPKLVSETWFGLLAPKGTPATITARINETVNAAMTNPRFRGRLLEMGYTPLGGTPERFATMLSDDIVKWGEVVRFSGAKID